MAEGVGLLSLSLFRYGIHFFIGLIIIKYLGLMHNVMSADKKIQILRGGLLFSATLCSFTTLSYLPQAIATSIYFTAPLIVLLIAPLLLKEKPLIRQYLYCFVGFGGVLIISRPSNGIVNFGVFWGLITALIAALLNIITRLGAQENPYHTLIWSGGVGFLALLILLPNYANEVYEIIIQREWRIIIALCLSGICGALGHLFLIISYKKTSASNLAPFNYLQIVSAVFLGWLIWGDLPDLTGWIGILLICSSGAAIALFRPK